MSTYTQIYLHLVYSTKYRECVISPGRRDDLLRYVTGVAKNRNCHIYCVNAVEDHIHFFFGLHPLISLSDFIKETKTASTRWIKENNIFQDFKCWQTG